MRIVGVVILVFVLAFDFWYLSHQKNIGKKQAILVQYNPVQNTYIQDKELLNSYSSIELEKMLEAGLEVLRWYDVLGKTKSTVVTEVTQGNSPKDASIHYPMGDVSDKDHHSHYFYHAHSHSANGHFHLFYRPREFVTPDYRSDDKSLFAHLIGISMDGQGKAVGLFTTNQWVTNESLFSSEDLEKMALDFDIDHAYPSWATNKWLTSMVQLFRPQIVGLWKQRDMELRNQQMQKPSLNILEDRELEITSKRPISVEQQIEVIQDILNERKTSNLEKKMSFVYHDFYGYYHRLYVHHDMRDLCHRHPYLLRDLHRT